MRATSITRVWARVSRRPLARASVVVLCLLCLVGVFAEVLASPAPLLSFGPRGTSLFPAVTRAAEYDGRSRRDIDRLHAGNTVVWPLVRFGPAMADDTPVGHPLGTDAQGRDLWARLIYGTRTALGLASAAVTLGLLLGLLLGGLAGYERGFWNDRLVRLVETIDTFPAILVVALVRAIEEKPSALSLVITVGLVRWAEIARLVRAAVLRESAEDYVLAARALGASPFRVFARHILPNTLDAAIVSSVFGVASVVLLETAISFLGMGAPSSSASWGETLAEGAAEPARIELLLWPGGLLLLTVGATYGLATALREALAPREEPS